MRRARILFFLLPYNCMAASLGALSVATGVFDLLRERSRTWELEVEYKFHVRALRSSRRYVELRPLIGGMATGRGAFYLYGGVNFDFQFFNKVHFAPGFAAGYYCKGSGKDLGYPLEFRSGVELGWLCGDSCRIGVHFYHLSNASLSRRNPGEESFVVFYDMPI